MNETRPTSTVTSIAIGSTLIITAVPGILTNSLVLSVLTLKGFLSAQSPPVYKFLCVLLSADLVSLLTTVAHTGPSTIVQNSFGNILPFVAGSLVMVTFYIDCHVMSLIAVNRLIAIKWPMVIDEVFTHRNSMVAAVISVLSPFFLTALGQFILPCCRFEEIPIVYGGAYVGAGINLQQYLIALPLNIATSLWIIVCYGIVLWKIQAAAKKVTISYHGKRQINEKERKARLIKQCILISIFYMVLWISFYVYGAVMQQATTKLEPYALITILNTMHTSVNSFIMIHYDATLKRRARELFGLAILGDGGATTVVPLQVRSTVSHAMKEQGAAAAATLPHAIPIDDYED